MAHRVLTERDLRVFLLRRRKGSGLIDPPPLGRFLAETLELAARLVPSAAGSLLLDDPTFRNRKSPLTFVATFGPTADQLIGVQVPVGVGIVGHVYGTGKTYATAEPENDARFFHRIDEALGFRTRSIVASPIRLEHTVCGVFELVNRRGRDSFSPHDIELVELLAHYMSRAILNAVDVLKQNHLALHDDLTGLRNVRGLESFLDEKSRQAEASGSDLAVLFADIDRLKQINDRYGHTAGSEALRRTAHGIAASVGGRGMVFRFGGDEFVVVCPDVDMDGAARIADELRKGVRATTSGPTPKSGNLPAISISVGVATLRGSLSRAQPRVASLRFGPRLLAAADRALYRAKRAGRARTVRATPRDDTLHRRKS